MAQTMSRTDVGRLLRLERQMRALMGADWTENASATTPDGESIPLAEMATAPARAAAAQQTADAGVTAAASAQELADTAAARAAQAIEDAAAAAAAAEAAEETAGAVVGQIAVAQQAADDANTSAQQALEAAQAAATTGGNAQQAADLAASAAQAAQEAADAAGTTAADADAAAAQAAADAAQAIADAQTAQQAATGAQTRADNAYTLANGRNRVFPQATAPTAAGSSLVVGDLWVDTANGRRLNTWNGTAWVLQQFGTEVFAAKSINAQNLFVDGSIYAAALNADAINGKTIQGATIRTGPAGTQRVQIDSTFGLVGYGPDGTTRLTQVGTDGILRALNAVITGTIQTADTGARVAIRQVQGGTYAQGEVRFYGADPDVGAQPSVTGWSSGVQYGTLDLTNGIGSEVHLFNADTPTGMVPMISFNAQRIGIPAGAFPGGITSMTAAQRQQLDTDRAAQFCEVYETDTGRVVWWDGTSWRLRHPETFSNNGMDPGQALANQGWAGTGYGWVPGLGGKLTVPRDSISRVLIITGTCSIAGDGWLRIRQDVTNAQGAVTQTLYHPNATGKRSSPNAEVTSVIRSRATHSGVNSNVFYLEARATVAGAPSFYVPTLDILASPA